ARRRRKCSATRAEHETNAARSALHSSSSSVSPRSESSARRRRKCSATRAEHETNAARSALHTSSSSVSPRSESSARRRRKCSATRAEHSRRRNCRGGRLGCQKAARAAAGGGPRPAEVYSAYNPRTVDRHFRWMEEHGLAGVFLQRFAVGLADPRLRSFRNAVLANVAAGAESHGRVFALMYDVSGHPREGLVEHVEADWRFLV